MTRPGIAAVVAGFAIGLSLVASAHENRDRGSGPDSTAFTAVTPILNVQSVEASISHYTAVLGFKKDWDWPDEKEDKTFASISNGKVNVFLCENGQGARPVWIYYSVNDVDELHEKYARAGAEIRQKPVDRPWGAREMLVADKDGHILRIGGPSGKGHEHGEGTKEHDGKKDVDGEGKKEHADGADDDDGKEKRHH